MVYLFEIGPKTICSTISLNGEESLQKLSDPDLDFHQHLINLFSSHTQPAHQISSESIHNFLRYLAHKQTDIQGWKHNILPPSMVVTFLAFVDRQINWWLTWNFKRIYISGHWIQSAENWDFRNTTLVVDLGTILTFWCMLTSKIIGCLNSVIWNINPLQISSQSDENWGT